MSKKINWALYGAAFSANLLSLIAGGSYSWTSPVLPKLKTSSEDNPLGTPITSSEESLIASLISLGASIGPILAAVVLDRIGRKKTLLLVCIPMTISHLILAFTTSINLYYFSRFFLGLGVGCIYSIIPIYMGEIAEDSNRGALGCFMNIMAVTGTLFCFTVGPYVSIKLFCLLFLIPPVVFIFTFGLFVPESPYYLLMVNREKEAEAALQKIRRGPIRKDLEEMKKNVEKSQGIQIKFIDLIKSKAITQGLFIGCGLMFLQQFSGITAIISYMQSIFDASESSLAPEISTIIIGVIQVAITLVTSQLVDRLGRRILLLTSLTGMLLSHTLMGLYFYLKTNNSDDVVSYLFWLPVCSLISFIITYSVGIGPVPWAMTGELFPPHFRSFASTCVTFFSLFLAFVLTVIFPNVTQIIGMACSFWLFAGFCMFGIVFVWRMVPETKGKSLRNIQNILEGNNEVK